MKDNFFKYYKKSDKEFIIYKSIGWDVSFHSIFCKHSYNEFEYHCKNNCMENVVDYDVPKIEKVDLVDKDKELVAT